MPITQVQTLLTRLDEMQQAHIDSFDTSLLPDLEAQISEREQGFFKLQQAMSELMPRLQASDELKAHPAVQDILDRIRGLLHQNQVLVSRVTAHRDGLKASLNRISAGKNALHGYGSSVSHRNRSAVLTFRN